MILEWEMWEMLMQKDEAWKQVEEKIYLDYLKLNMRNK